MSLKNASRLHCESASSVFTALAFFLTVRTLIICASYWQKTSERKTLEIQLTEAVWGKLISLFLMFCGIGRNYSEELCSKTV